MILDFSWVHGHAQRLQSALSTGCWRAPMKWAGSPPVSSSERSPPPLSARSEPTCCPFAFVDQCPQVPLPEQVVTATKRLSAKTENIRRGPKRYRGPHRYLRRLKPLQDPLDPLGLLSWECGWRSWEIHGGVLKVLEGPVGSTGRVLGSPRGPP